METEIENIRKWKRICIVLLVLIPLGVIIILTFTDPSIEHFFYSTIGYLCMGIGVVAAFSLYAVFPRALAGLYQVQDEGRNTAYKWSVKQDIGLFMAIFLSGYGIDLILPLVQGTDIFQSDILWKAFAGGVIAAVLLMFVKSLPITDKAK